MKHQNKSFSVAVGSKLYAENWERIFKSKKPSGPRSAGEKESANKEGEVPSGPSSK